MKLKTKIMVLEKENQRL